MGFRVRGVPYLLLLFFSLGGNAAAFGAESRPGLAAFEEGRALLKQGLLPQAEARLDKAIQQEPANADYHYELASLHAARFDRWKKKPSHSKAQAHLENSARHFEQAVMSKPDFLEARFNLGVVYKHQGRYEEAREQFKQALALEPRTIQAWLQIGNTYELQGFYDEAKDAYLKAKEMDYYNPGIAASLEDLKTLEEESTEHQRMRDEAASRAMMLSRGFPYSPHSSARQQFQQEFQQGQGAAQALPFLAAVLVEQFLNRKGAPEEDD